MSRVPRLQHTTEVKYLPLPPQSTCNCTGCCLTSILASTALLPKACTLTTLIASNSSSLSILWTRTFLHFLAKWFFSSHCLHLFPHPGHFILLSLLSWPQHLQEIFFADLPSGVWAQSSLVFDMTWFMLSTGPDIMFHLQLSNFLTATRRCSDSG